MNSIVKTDVVIVGAGPVGLTAAIDLNARGISTVVIEKRPFLEPPNVKCNHVSARTMERFRRLGIAPLVRNAGLPADHPQDISFRTTMTGRELTRIQIPARQDRYTSDEGPDTAWATPEPPHRINQTFLEPILMRHAAELPHVTLLDETLYHRFVQTGSGVDVTISDIEGGNEQVVHGRILIGADGGRSAVRKQIGATLSGDPILQYVQSTCIRAEDLHSAMSGEKAWGYYTLNPRRNGHIYSIDGEEIFLVHNYLTHEEYEDASIDRDWAIRTILGVDASFRYDVVSKEDWVARRLVADKFRDGNVFIAGDACHLWVPYAGYGMNAGIADVLNLTWLIGAYLGGWADYAILESYEAERLPITEQVSQFAMAHQRKVAQSDVPADIEDDTDEGKQARELLGRTVYDLNVQQFAAAGLNFGYNYKNSPLISYDGEIAPAYTMGEYIASTVPGCRAPHFWLAETVSLYDELGQGYTLLCFDDRSAAQPLVDAAETAGVPLKVIVVPAGAAPEEYRHRFLICREDQHIAWRSDDIPADAGELFEKLRGGHAIGSGRPSSAAHAGTAV